MVTFDRFLTTNVTENVSELLFFTIIPRSLFLLPRYDRTRRRLHFRRSSSENDLVSTRLLPRMPRHPRPRFREVDPLVRAPAFLPLKRRSRNQRRDRKLIPQFSLRARQHRRL
jgi:hypothetical protein